MPEQHIGIRELKAKLSAYIRQAKMGKAIVITEHGRPVARIIPDASSLDERISALSRSGAFQWSGRRPQLSKSRARISGRRSLSQLISEGRE